MIETKLRMVTDVVNGIEMSFVDGLNSWTVSEVFEELKNNPYGIDDAILSPKDILIDVGANIGMFSIYAHIKFGCKIIAFEPIIENVNNFKRNILLNRLDPDFFEIHHCAITSKDGTWLKIGKLDYNSGGCSEIFSYVSNYENCRTETLNKYIHPECKFLKMDCEGSEYDVIPNLLDKLNLFKYIGIEYHETNDKSPHELHKVIKNNFNGILHPNEIGRTVQIKSFF